MPAKSAHRFIGVTTWIFDLDNTLYPPHADLWPKVDAKITSYISEFLGVDGLTARAIQKYYYQTHGTTLNGLMQEHGIDPHAFLDFVHDIDRSNLPPDARLAGAIRDLPGRKFVFTNGSRRHAEDTMRQLGIDHLFEDVFDIVASEFVPKPARRPYERFLEAHAISAVTSAMFEDIPRNLEVPAQLGMRTVLVVPDTRGDHKEDWERYVEHGPGADGVRFDAVTHDLPMFLEGLAARLMPVPGT
ncbi:MAG: putative hydrolase of the HAD [Beijerinckiaceae bacterium]|nr:MAG: putative hydrolase of the HAD [Beijerinckiaceae bacterium]